MFALFCELSSNSVQISDLEIEGETREQDMNR